MRTLLWITAILLLIAIIPSAAEIRVGEPVQLRTPEGRFTMPSFSADSRYIAFSSARYDGLYTSDWQGNISTVAQAPLAGWRYSWSPDGANLVYRIRYDAATTAMAGNVSRPDGQAQFHISDWQSDLNPPQCTKNGIEFKAGDDMLTVDESGNVKCVKSLSKGQGIVSRVAALSAAFFANGFVGVTTTAFAALVPASEGKLKGKSVFTNTGNELWTVDEKGEMKRLLDVTGESGLFSPQTSPAGDAVAAPGLSGKLYIADSNTGAYINLGAGQNPAWSPDGNFIVYEVATEDGHDITGSELWVASKDGKYQHQLELNKGIKRYPTWSPDGSTLAYEVDGKIYYVPVERK